MKRKVAVVTGAAKGLGEAFALHLGGDYRVVVHFRKSRKDAKKVLKNVQKLSPDSFLVSCDLTDQGQVSKMFGEIRKKAGRVDLLVNNVGNFLYKEFSKTTEVEFRDVVESNLYSTYFCSKAVLPVMRRQKSGQIINIGTVGANLLTVREKSAPYFMAKNAIYFLTKAVAHEEAKYGIRVNMISPASLAEDIFKARDFPMGRSAKYRDVLNVLNFLLSEKSEYISGANIEVAGGFIAGVDKAS